MRVAISLPRAAIDRLWPPVPAAVRDDYALSQYRRLMRQMPLLHLALLIILFATMNVANPHAHAAVRLGIPGAVLLACIARLAVWSRREQALVSPEFARRRIAGMTWFSGLVAAFASLWCIASWLTAPHHDAINVPLLMVLGEIMVVISMTPLRAAAYANLIIGTGPITLALALWGDNMERVIALAIAATATFLIGMLRHQHGEAVQRLLLEQRLASLAHSDALTGIANRRGLEAAFARLAAQHTKPALILIDLDKFKPINDRHGHEVGDMVLVKVAARLRAAVVDDGTVCRLGGDEFAVLLGAYASRPPERVAGAILSALSRPVVIAGNPLTIGASLGIACCNGDENLAQLLARADAAMYRAKRGEVEGARPVQPVRKAWVMG